MRRENRSSRPGGDKAQGGRKPGGERRGQRSGSERGGSAPGGFRSRQGTERSSQRPDGERSSARPGSVRSIRRPDGERSSARPGAERSSQRPGSVRSIRRPGSERSGQGSGFERGSQNQGSERSGQRSEFGRGSLRSGGDRSFKRAGSDSHDQKPVSGGRRIRRVGERREGERTFGERRSPEHGRFGGDPTASRQRVPRERSGTSRQPGSGRGKLLLRKERRPSRGELLRDLGYSDHKSYRDSARRASNAVPEVKGDLIRLNRFIANSGICSRREADKYISAGVVVVNGQIVTELGSKVSPDDEVRFDGRLITPERKVYLLLNKPKDFVTTTDDPHATQTVMDLIKNACEERVYPVGRLDRNTTGLLLFTNDGDMAKRLSHPSHKVDKVYQVTLDKNVSVNDIQKIADGFELEDGFIAADAITYVEGMEKNVIGIEIHSGRTRIVRRIFEHLGYRVKGLDRVSYAGLTKKNLPRGRWRFLSPPEVSYLKMK
jgi:23S rRNA pseudouridine2605 synthase